MKQEAKFKWYLIVPIALLVFVNHEIALAAQRADVRSAIEEANNEFITAMSRGNAAAMAALYTADAKVLPPHSDIVSGRPAIEQFWDGVIKSGVKGGALKTLEVENKGDSLFETGTYALTGAGDKVLDTGKYLVIWKRQKGKWKIHRDIWNTNTPAPKE